MPGFLCAPRTVRPTIELQFVRIWNKLARYCRLTLWVPLSSMWRSTLVWCITSF